MNVLLAVLQVQLKLMQLFVKHYQEHQQTQILMNNHILHLEVFQVLLHSMKIDFGLLVQQVNLMEYGRRKLQSFLTLMLALD